MLAGCSGNAQPSEDEPVVIQVEPPAVEEEAVPEPEPPDDDTADIAVIDGKETIEFDNNNSVRVEIPDSWDVTQMSGTYVPGLADTYDLQISPPEGTKAFLSITVGMAESGTMGREQFDRLVDGRINLLLPEAVEETADYLELLFDDGYGKYCILTDASLVDQVLDEDEYLYVAVIFTNYINGCISYSTALFDSPESPELQTMLDIITSIEPQLEGVDGPV